MEGKALVSTTPRKEFEMFTRSGLQIKVPPDHQVLYSKNYEGDLKREGKQTSKSYRFYDEREWRIVPNSSQIYNFTAVLQEDAYHNEFLTDVLSGCGYLEVLNNWLTASVTLFILSKIPFVEIQLIDIFLHNQS